MFASAWFRRTGGISKITPCVLFILDGKIFQPVQECENNLSAISLQAVNESLDLIDFVIARRFCRSDLQKAI